MKRSRKQERREALTTDQVRARQARKNTEALRALYVMQGGTVAWQAYLNQCRRERNARVKAHTAEVLAAKREVAAAVDQPDLWSAA